MIVIDPGHAYILDVYDGDSFDPDVTIDFMKREGAEYPSNKGYWPGTNCQEVLRVLIDRVLYLDNQKPCLENKAILICLRLAIWYFEVRAARRRGKNFFAHVDGIERLPACSVCGHINCEHLNESGEKQDEQSGAHSSDREVP